MMIRKPPDVIATQFGRLSLVRHLPITVGGLAWRILRLERPSLEETDTNFAIGWTGHFLINGPAFIYTDQTSGPCLLSWLPDRSNRPKGSDLKISNIFGWIARPRRACRLDEPGTTTRGVMGSPHMV